MDGARGLRGGERVHAPSGGVGRLRGRPPRARARAGRLRAVGRLPGQGPRANEVILLSAHIDHVGTGRGPAPAGGDTIYNGADDDASGSIAVLALARALAAGPPPARTLVFAWFGSEESGGTGSRYFADRPVVPLDRIVANLQFEMIGRPDPQVPPHTLWLTGFERSTLGPELAKRGAKLVQDPHPEQNFFERSDNIQFARRGVIAHTVSSFGLHKEYHQPSDEIGTIDFAHMTDAIRSMVDRLAARLVNLRAQRIASGPDLSEFLAKAGLHVVGQFFERLFHALLARRHCARAARHLAQ